jgi:hypothetical protein
MTMKAMPLSEAMPVKKASMASRPPAEAPTATYSDGRIMDRAAEELADAGIFGLREYFMGIK